MHLWGIPGIFKQLEELASFPSWKEEMLGCGLFTIKGETLTEAR